MTIKVWKEPTWPTYIVQVDASIYEMSERANEPNGVCMYVGGTSQRPERDICTLVDWVPVGIVRQIVYIVQRDDLQ